MKTIIVGLFLLVAGASRGQMIQLVPSNFSQTITAQNNDGAWFQSWRDSAMDRIVLSNRVLTFVHTVFFDSAYMGTKLGGPKMLEDTFRYRQIGGAAYVPIGGEAVTFFAPKASGGWIARTNYVAVSDMQPVFWLPSFVGDVTTGDMFTRTITAASSLEIWGRNIGGGPYLLRIPCEGQGFIGFSFLNRFNLNERKLFTLSMEQARAALTAQQIFSSGVHFFSFNLDDLPEETPL